MIRFILYLFSMYATCLVPFAFIYLVNGEILGLVKGWGIFWVVTAFIFFGFIRSMVTGLSHAMSLLGAALWIWFLYPTDSTLNFSNQLYEIGIVPILMAMVFGPIVSFMVIPKRKKR